MRVPSVWIALVLATVALGGCAPVDASPEPSLTPSTAETSTPEPLDPDVATIVIGGDALTIYAGDGSAGEVLRYTDSSVVFIGRLGELFGAEPVVSTHEREWECDPSYTMMSWDGFAVITHEDFYADENPKVHVVAHTASIAGYAVTSSIGLAVGDDGTAEFARQPDDLKYEGDWEGKAFSYFYFDVITPPVPLFGSYDDEDEDEQEWPWGAYLSATDGIVDTLAAPDIPGMAEGC